MAQTAQSDPIQEFIALPRDQQMSTLQQLAPDKQDKLLEKVKEYRSGKPLAESGTPPQKPGVLEGIERGKNDVINVFRPLSAEERGGIESTMGKYPGAAFEGVSNATLGVASAGANLLLHPLGSVYGTAQLAADALNQLFPDSGLNPQQKAAKQASLERLKSQWEQIKENPDWAMGNIVGGIEAGKAIGDSVVGPATKALKDTAAKAREGVRTGAQSLVGAGERPIKAEVVKAGETAKAADESHLAETRNALHETAGRELQYQQGVKAAQETADAANKALDEQHLKATHDALEQTREKEDLYQNELRKAKAESEEAYQKKVKEVDEKRAKAEADRQQQVRDYFRKKAAIRKAREDAQDAATRKLALARGVEHLDPEIKGELEKTYETAKENANKPYNELRSELDHVEADPEKMELIVADGAESIRGSETQPTVLKNMSERLEAMKRGTRHDNFTYDDLQGYREEIGRELRKGTLPPDVFDAYKKMLDGITNEMEGIARRVDEREALDSGKTLPKDQTLEGKLKAARTGYREYAETFLDKDSPIRKALNTVERGQVTKSFLGKDQSGIEALAKYNPELARRLNVIRGYQSEASGIRPSTVNRQSPVLPPREPPIPAPEPGSPREVAQPTRVEPPDRPTPVEAKLPKQPTRVEAPDRPDQTEVNTRAMRERLIDRWATGESSLNKWQVRALLSGGLSAVINGLGLLGGHTPGIGSMALEAGGTAAYTFGPAMVAKLLDNPGFREWITRPPEGELDTLLKLPNADRITITNGLKQVAQAAQRKGIKVSPTLAALIGATAVRGPKSKKIQQTRDEWYATHPR